MPDTLVKDEVPVSSLAVQDTFYVSAYSGTPDVYLDRQVTFQVLAGSVNAAISGLEVNEAPTGTIDGTNAAFTLSYAPVGNSLQVFKNGLLQEISATGDLTVSGVTLTFLAGAIPLPGDKLRAMYHR